MSEELEEIVGCGVGCTLAIPLLVGLVASTVGAFGVGVYEGCTGDRVFGETSSMLVAAGTAYATQVLSGVITMDGEATMGAIMFPLGPVAGVAIYGAGYGLGSLIS
jgi:hypothetical protein